MQRLSERMSTSKSGFHVKYEVKETKLGLGLFVMEPVAKGTLLWSYKKGENILSLQGEEETRQHLATLQTDVARRDWLEHAYHDGGTLNYILDDGGLWNHSAVPNTGGQEDGLDSLSSYALRDLAAGEELLDDYGTYEYPVWLVRLCKEYQVDMEYFDLPSQGERESSAR